jgi:hypothetical protein
MGHSQAFFHIRMAVSVAVTAALVSACAPKPMLPYSEETVPLVLFPVSQAGIKDERGRFREIFCAVLEERGNMLPDYRPCADALVRVGKEPEGCGKPVELGPSSGKLTALFVPGFGWDCFSDWLDVDDSIPEHLRSFGYDWRTITVDGLSSSTNNARQIRDAIMAKRASSEEPNLVLIGYSKGVPDMLEALVDHPEIRERIAAVVSLAGAVGGTPLANITSQSQLDLLRLWPDARCKEGDGGAMESLRPSVRKSWLANNSLPDSLPYFSLVTYPKPDSISSILHYSYEKLSRIDARNDGQVIFYDQVIPSSTLLGFANADHWALVVPIARSHPTIGTIFADRNQYPREAMFEAILRFIEEQLDMFPR